MQAELIAQYSSSWAWVILVSTLVLAALTACGQAWLAWLPSLRLAQAPLPRRCEELLQGCMLFSVAGFAAALLGIRLPWTFAALCAAALVTLLLRRERGAGRAPAPLPRDDARLHWIALAIMGAGALLWSWLNLRGLEPAGAGTRLVPWVDFFFHARQIGDFAQFRGDLGSLNYSMAGEPPAPYHYGSYMVSSLVSSLGGIPSIQLATTLYPVLGMLLTGAAALLLGEAAAGAGAALAGVALLFLLPDPTCWRPGSTRWDSYFFFQQVGVGGAYAVALMGLALAHALKGMREHAPASCLWALALFCTAALFKMQIFLAYSLFFFLFVIAHAPGLRPAWRLLCATGFVALFVLVANRMGQVPNAPTLALALPFEHWRAYLDDVPRILHMGELAAALPWLLGPLAALALWLKTFGVLLPVGGWLAFRLRHDAGARLTIELLLLSCISLACVRLLVADNTGFGDVAEINRKTLVWPYFVFVHCTAMLGWRAWSGTLRRPLARRWLLPAAAAGLLAFVGASAQKLQSGAGLSDRNTHVAIAPGLLETAHFLRTHAGPGEALQLCENDRYNQLATLAERPVYIAKLVVNTPALSAKERARFAVVDEILQAPDVAAARARMQAAGIGWFVLSPNCQAGWEAGQAPAYAAGGYRVHRATL